MPEPSIESKKLLKLLKGVDFFEKLKLGELEDLIKKIKKKSVSKGDVVIEEGKVGDAFYMIAEGRVSVWHKKNDENIFLTYQKPGDFFGEMALVTRSPRSATVIAEEASTFYVLYSFDFKEILMNNPKISGMIEDALRARRLRSAQKRGQVKK